MKLTKNYSTEDFDCKDGTPVPQKYYANVKALAENLEVLNDELDTVMRISGSGYRTPTHNAKVSKSTKSQHLTASAADISSPEHNPIMIIATIERLILEGKMKQGGTGLYASFVHYDIRGTKARWKF